MAGYKSKYDPAKTGVDGLIFDKRVDTGVVNAPTQYNAEQERMKNEQARKMYEDAMANNALLQDMRNRVAQPTAPVQNAMTGVTNSIANTALQNAVVAPEMAGGAIRSKYQGS